MKGRTRTYYFPVYFYTIQITNNIVLCRTLSQLQVSGNYSVAEMTSWLTEALPGELPRPASEITFVRIHTLLETILICEYQ